MQIRCDDPVTLQLPGLDLDTSALLRAALDDRFFCVSEFAADGLFPNHRDAKEEVERLIVSIQGANSAQALFEAAKSDWHLMRGLSLANPRPYSPIAGTRSIAFRQLELLLAKTIAQLNDAALRPPLPEDRACRAIPGLFKAFSPRDGLLPLRLDMIPEQFGDDRLLVFGDHALYPHPDIREARELVGVLWALAAGHDVRIPVDPHRVVPADDIPDISLKDYWWGIRIARDSLDDLEVIGQTRHERRADRHDEFGAYPLLATDFLWKREDELKILTVEETVPNEEPRPFPGPVRNRYLHSIRDTERRAFVHLDGAVKAYAREQYAADREHPTGSKGEFLHYRKLWRVEGPIDDRNWGGSLATSSVATSSSSSTSAKSSTNGPAHFRRRADQRCAKPLGRSTRPAVLSEGWRVAWESRMSIAS